MTYLPVCDFGIINVLDSYRMVITHRALHI